MQQLTIAGSMSIPVISQALGILAAEGLAVIDDEGDPDLGPNVTVLALAGPKARFPSHFLRQLPADIDLRRQQAEARSLGISDRLIGVPNLVLVHVPHNQGPDALYTGSALTRFEAALKNLVGIRPPKMKRNRGRGRRIRGFGLVREIC